MEKQNIYDNEAFFEGYKQIREKENNANNLFEEPALFSLLPNLKDKTILDLGCGFGNHCMQFKQLGAKKVVGIDISEKMLAIARKENSHGDSTYLNITMENIGELNDSFDLVVSSLAFHYIEDFTTLIGNIYDLLSENGTFVFSQENPLNTCFCQGQRWTVDSNGQKLYANISNYGTDGERESVWFVDHVKKYHRTFSTIVNTLVDAGFIIEKMIEPVPTEEMVERYPKTKDLYHKPDFLVVKVRK